MNVTFVTIVLPAYLAYGMLWYGWEKAAGRLEFERARHVLDAHLVRLAASDAVSGSLQQHLTGLAYKAGRGSFLRSVLANYILPRGRNAVNETCRPRKLATSSNDTVRRIAIQLIICDALLNPMLRIGAQMLFICPGLNRRPEAIQARASLAAAREICRKRLDEEGFWNLLFPPD